MATTAAALNAVDALRGALRVPPERMTAGTRWRDVAACSWRAPWLSSYELPETEELIVALHTGGSRSVRARVRGSWTTSGSTPGHLHVIPAGFPTAFMPKGELEFISVHIRPDRLRSLAEPGEAPKERIPFRFAFHDSFVLGCVQALNDEMRAPREHGPLYVNSVTDALILHLLRPSPQPVASARARTTMSPRVLARVCERIDASMETGVSLDDLAAEAGTSRFHFAHAFREAMGLPPHRYLTLRRIERAKDLLRHTDLSLAEIAPAVGFSSQSHFTLRFRAAVGETPRAFRGRG